MFYALFALAGTLCAADLTGSWVASSPGFGGGPPQETQFNFVQQGTKLSGKVLGRNGEQPIAAGQVNGDTFMFEVSMDMFGQSRVMKYEGSIAGDELKIRMVPPAGGFGPPRGPGGPGGPRPPGAGGPGPGGPPGGPGGRGGPGRFNREMIARRGVSERLQKQAAEDARRPKPTLPELKKLPYNGLAKTPPMGWNSWNKFRLNISDTLIRETADIMVSSGMRDAGYIYLNLDDGWQSHHDEQGNIHTNLRFPDMKALGDYIHSKGLKFGIYTSPGPRSCGNQDGAYGYEAKDAKAFAAWGVDYVKYDWCSASRIYSQDDAPRVYQLMGEALRASGRPIVFSLCQYGFKDVWKWGTEVGGNLWRTTGDIRDSYDSMAQIGFSQSDLAQYAGPGHWNDPDMLEVGNGGMNPDEERTHMSLWAILAAPLLAGNDIRDMNDTTRSILLNREVIAVNQDPLGVAGKRVAKKDDIEVWSRALKDGAWAIGIFNRGTSAWKGTLRLSEMNLKGSWKVRDLWKHADSGKLTDGYDADVAPHGVVMLRLSH